MYGAHAALSKLNRSKLNKQTNSTKNSLLIFDSSKNIRSRPLHWKTSQLQKRKEEPLDTKIHHCVKRRWSPSIIISTIQTLLPPLPFLCVKSIGLLSKPYWRVLTSRSRTKHFSFFLFVSPTSSCSIWLLFVIYDSTAVEPHMSKMILRRKQRRIFATEDVIENEPLSWKPPFEEGLIAMSFNDRSSRSK